MRYITPGTPAGRAMGKGRRRTTTAIALTFLLAGGGSPGLFAPGLFAPGLFAAEQNATWLGGTGNWTDPTKWSTGVVPNNNAPADTFSVNIDNGNATASAVRLG